MKRSVPNKISQKYKLPQKLTDFQLSLYIHLIQWKWKYLTEDPGKHGQHFYDAILPKPFKDEWQPLYRPIVKDIQEKHPFKVHKHFGHMASSQAACINLFTPVLRNENIANTVFPTINPNFSRLATNQIEEGFQFEYWDKSNPLNDHTDAAGTDSDIAIAYYDTNNDLSLWLIEHKLTEDEFTTCGGYKSKGNTAKAQCKNGAEILRDHQKCYYHYSCQYKYWELTDAAKLYNFDALEKKGKCPFMGGENQLWRNQLMAYAVREKGQFERVHFSVVHHPQNSDLQSTMNSYTSMLNDKTLFSVFTSKQIIDVAREIDDEIIQNWTRWYSELYKIA